MIKSVIGFTQPQRIQLFNPDGTVYCVFSVPLDVDAEKYAEELLIRMTGYTYVILEPD